MAERPLRIAVVGAGRIGGFHARHIQELASELRTCVLVAVSDAYGDTAIRVAEKLQPAQDSKIRAFDSASELAASGISDAAVIASRTEHHIGDAKAFIDAGHRVLLEKPLSDSAESAADFVAYLNGDAVRSRALMLAFMRRFDRPLLHAKRLLDSGAIGEPFKVSSVLEDNHPPPDGYQSPGLLPDMSVHNIDEVLWLLGKFPNRLIAAGANLHNHKVTSVAEDVDDAFLQLWFEGAIGQVQVSRNHVAGYRNETRISGDRGVIHVGHFQEDPRVVHVEAYGPGRVIEKRVHGLREYGSGVPVFISRFGEAYKSEVARFVRDCLDDKPFPVTHADGYNAILIAEAGRRAMVASGGATPIDFGE